MFIGECQEGRDLHTHIEQCDGTEFSIKLGTIPYCIWPEEVVQVPDTVNMEEDVLVEESFNLSFIVQTYKVHGYALFSDTIAYNGKVDKNFNILLFKNRLFFEK
jgi:hypothetical protein